MKIYLIIIYLFLFQVENQLTAQVQNVVNLNSIECDSMIISHTISVNHNTDSLYPLNIKYTFENGELLQGKFFFDLEFENQYIKHPYLIGVYPSTSDGLDYCYNNSDDLISKVTGSFDNGKPCSRWVIVTNWQTRKGDIFKNSPLYIRKEADYNNGLLHGRYTIFSKPDYPLYTTTFTNGTGYYKDYYPTYDDKKMVRLEGALLNGVKDGVWIYYIRSDNGADDLILLREIYLEYYDKGKLYNYIILKPDSEVEDKIKKTIEWERQPKKVRKGKENPYLE